MARDTFGTIGNALRIGGGQWAGKSAVARILSHRHGITAYHGDYHDARAHDDPADSTASAPRRTVCWPRSGHALGESN
jgi:hypothetical protein